MMKSKIIVCIFLVTTICFFSCSDDDSEYNNQNDSEAGVFFLVNSGSTQRLHFLNTFQKEMKYSIYANVNQELIGNPIHIPNSDYVIDLVKHGDNLFAYTSKDSIKIINATTLLKENSFKIEVEDELESPNMLLYVDDESYYLTNYENMAIYDKDTHMQQKSISLSVYNLEAGSLDQIFVLSNNVYTWNKEESRLNAINPNLTSESLNIFQLENIRYVTNNNQKIYALTADQKVLIIDPVTNEIEEEIAFDGNEELDYYFCVDENKIYVLSEQGGLFRHTLGENGFEILIDNISNLKEDEEQRPQNFFIKDGIFYYYEFGNIGELWSYNIEEASLVSYYINNYRPIKTVFK